MALALRNAKSLVAEAKILARARANGRALVLGALALEEAGKVVWLTLLAHSDHLELSEAQMKKLWRQFRGHKLKTTLVLHGAWKSILYLRRRKHRHAEAEKGHRLLVRAYASVGRALAKARHDELDEMKLSCVYVDYRGGRFVAPARVSSTAARSITLIGDSAIRDAGRLRDTFRRSNTDSLAEAIGAVMFKSQLLQEALETLQGEATQTAEAQVAQ